MIQAIKKEIDDEEKKIIAQQEAMKKEKIEAKRKEITNNLNDLKIQ